MPSARVPGSRFSAQEIEIFRRGLESQERAAAAAAGRLTSAGNLPAKSGRVRDRIAERCGVGRRTVDKIAEIYAALEVEPDRFAAIVAELDDSGSVDGAHRKMKRLQDEARVLGLVPIEGRFRTVVFDPPWEDESVSEAQRPPYATMPLDAIRAMPVERWQLDEGHIYVHVPGPFVALAIGLIGHWGYAYKTLIAWKKSRWSMGRYFRTQDEFVAFGVRGNLMVRRQDIPNHFDGPVGEHSEKPRQFYDLVRAASFPPYGEAFQRNGPDDFTNLYQPAPAPIAVAAE